jgi:RNA polymerase sigma factor (sigma-70 family)
MPVEMNANEPLPTRASLLDRLRDPGDDLSWEEFHRLYRGLLTGVARRAGLSEDEAQEAVQEVLIAAARKLPEFVYRPGEDSFKGWLLRIARWKVADQFRKRQGRLAPDDGTIGTSGEGNATDPQATVPVTPSCPELSALPDPSQDFEAIWTAEWERHLLGQALASVKRQANPAHYAIYHLHVIEERPVEEVRQILRVTIAQVYLAKHRVGRLVRRHLRRLRDGSPME